MQLILSKEMESQLLSDNDDIKSELKTILENEFELSAHTIGKLRGKNYIGNVPEIVDEVTYAELEILELNF